MVLVSRLTARPYPLVVLLIGGLLLRHGLLHASLLLLNGLSLLKMLVLIILAKLVLLELMHKVLLVSGLHSTRRWVEHHGLLKLLSLFTWRQHLDIVTVATLARQSCHVINLGLRQITFVFIFGTFHMMVLGLLLQAALRQDRVIVRVFFIDSCHFWFGGDRRVRDRLSMLSRHVITLLSFLPCHRRFSTWLLASDLEWPVEVTTAVKVSPLGDY